MDTECVPVLVMLMVLLIAPFEIVIATVFLYQSVPTFLFVARRVFEPFFFRSVC